MYVWVHILEICNYKQRRRLSAHHKYYTETQPVCNPTTLRTASIVSYLVDCAAIIKELMKENTNHMEAKALNTLHCFDQLEGSSEPFGKHLWAGPYPHAEKTAYGISFPI